MIGDKARHIERQRNDSTARPPFVALMRATSPVSSGESTHDQSEKYIPVSSSVGFFTIVQNDVK